jgi:fermentation-respiration switch protein FrsA (DUF1100 family)
MKGAEPTHGGSGPSLWRRSAGSILAIMAVAYLLLMGHSYFFADRVIFQPPAPSYRDGESILKIPVGEHSALSALHLPNPGAGYTILYSHGNAEDLGDIRGTLARYRERGFSIIAYDYRGYGTSPGRPSEEAACADIGAVYDHLVRQVRVPPERIIVYGRSLGGGPSVDLAARRPVAGLVLESSFVSIFRVMVRVPIFPFDKFENLRKVGKVACPIFVIHGTRDEIVPFWHGETLYRQAREPKLRLWVDGADHDNLVQVAGEEYWRGLARFTRLIEGNRRGGPGTAQGAPRDSGK